MKGLFCTACGENLRGRKMTVFDGKAICTDPCGIVSRKKRPFWYGALEISGPDLLRLFAIETRKWSRT